MKILVSQKQPSNLTPYEPLKKKFGAEIEFKPFFLIEPLSSREFRAQRINLQDYTAVVFSSRHAIDAYFQLAENLRFKVPDTMKYFCTTELVAMYLQKHIVYRKRKIFYGDGKPESVVALIGPKHKGEKFLITASEGSDVSNLTTQDLTTVDFASCDVVVLYNKFDINALYASYPDFQQGDLKMIAYGKSIAKAMEEAGLKIAAQGPTPATPSAAKTIETYLDSCAKGKGAAKK